MRPMYARDLFRKAARLAYDGIEKMGGLPRFLPARATFDPLCVQLADLKERGPKSVKEELLDEAKGILERDDAQVDKEAS